MYKPLLSVVLWMLCCVPAGAQTWSELVPTGGAVPSARVNAAMVYDPAADRLVVFGGRGAGGDRNDVWAFDLETRVWTEITPGSGPAPEARYTHNALYDPETRRMVVWSGRQAGSAGSILFNDLWALALGAPGWTRIEPAGARPNVRYGTAAVYDPVDHSLVNFAGFTEAGRFDDTWRFGLESGAWTELAPQGNPGPRCLHAAAYDSRRRRMLIYGGQRGAGALGDLWSLDLEGAVWSELTPESGPEGRRFPAMAYDGAADRVLLFGGETDAGNSDELWAFSLAEGVWQRLAVEGGPAARNGMAAVFLQGRLLLFGGAGDAGTLNDVWALEGLWPTAVAASGTQPAAFALEPNFPNPFNPQTEIPYRLARAGDISLRVYDLLGRPVAVLASGWRAVGAHRARWDGRDAQGRPVAAGVYIVRLESGGQTASRKAVLAK